MEASEQAAGPEPCVCAAGSLDILTQVQRAYEDRLDRLRSTAGRHSLEKQLSLLQAWVGDLVSQNALLARTVEELETEATARLLLERRRHAEMESELRTETAVLRKRLVRKDSDLRGLLEVLRRLREFDHCTIDGIHFNEITESDIFGSVLWDNNEKKTTGNACETKMINESLMAENVSKDRDVSKKDAEVTADICCSGNRERCRDAEPVKECGAVLQQDQLCQEPHHMAISIKASSDEVRALRQANAALREELRGASRVCAALDAQARAAALRAQFKDDIIREMRRQLRQAKAQLKEVSESARMLPQRDGERDSETPPCVQQPRRQRRAPADSCSWRHRCSTSDDDVSFNDD